MRSYMSLGWMRILNGPGTKKSLTGLRFSFQSYKLFSIKVKRVSQVIIKELMKKSI